MGKLQAAGPLSEAGASGGGRATLYNSLLTLGPDGQFLPRLPTL